MLRAAAALGFGLAIQLCPESGAAQTPHEDEPRGADAASSGPREHFEQALVQYRAGRYRDAIRSIQAALALDPGSKDLLFNLARLHEKLGELDASIQWLERYIEHEADPAEVERAREAIVRMRGARAEVDRSRNAEFQVAQHQRGPTPSPAEPRRTATGVDGWVIAGTGLTAAAALAGIVFGMRALVLKPDGDRGNTEAPHLEQRERRARDSAVLADIAFSVSLLAGASTAFLWYTRAPDCPTSGGAPVGVSFSGVF